MLQTSATSNYGQDSIIKVDTKSGANARSLVTATLRPYASSYKDGRTLHALQLAAPWTESGVTWANQPATTGAAAAVASGFG